MDLQVLDEFVTLSITRNFSVAAEQLLISQPSLSRHMRALEAEMGAELIERTTPLMLTDAGKATLNMATTVLSAVTATKRSIAAGKACGDGRSLSVEDTFYCPCFSEFNYRYAKEARDDGLPRMEVRALAPGKTSFDCILEKRLDFAFLSNVGIEGTPVELPPAPEGLVVEPLPNSVSRVCFLVDKNGPLARKGPLALADFADVPIMMPVSTAFDYERRCVMRLCEGFGGFSPRFDWQQVNTLQEFFSLNPQGSAFFTTDALIGRYQQYSAWVIENTVALHPADATYVRQLFLVRRAGEGADADRVARKIAAIWAEEGYYGE